MDSRILAIIIFAVCLLLYTPLNRTKARYFWKTKLDDLIPLLPVFVIPYISFYFWILVSIGLLFNSEIFGEFIRALITAQIAALIFWTLFRNGVKKKPLENKDIFSKLINFIYSIDGGTNGFPSSHVYISLICGFYLSTAGFWWGLPGGMLITLSTVLVKQHYVIDVPGGVLWSILAVMTARLS